MRNSQPTTFNVLLIYPRFPSLSFWNYRATCEVSGARYPAAPLGLITVAAMLPTRWNCPVGRSQHGGAAPDDDLEWADIVLTGGMLPQQMDTLTLIDLCKARGKPWR